jgi:hypothetical protein
MSRALHALRSRVERGKVTVESSFADLWELSLDKLQGESSLEMPRAAAGVARAALHRNLGTATAVDDTSRNEHASGTLKRLRLWVDLKVYDT